MKAIVLALLVAASPRAAQAEDLSKLTSDQLIDRLTALDNQTLGQQGVSIWHGLDVALPACRHKPATASNIPPSILAAMPPPVVQAPVADELVRRGPEALPALLAHLNDARESHYLLASAVRDPADPANPPWVEFQWAGFTDWYDARHRDGKHYIYSLATGPENGLPSRLYARIGDLSFMLIGQIVDRDYGALRFGATGGAVYESPVRQPALAAKLKADWSGLSHDDYRQYLLEEVRGDDLGRTKGALLRLKFYFPTDYAALAGAEGTARDHYEQIVCDPVADADETQRQRVTVKPNS